MHKYDDFVIQNNNLECLSVIRCWTKAFSPKPAEKVRCTDPVLMMFMIGTMSP